MLLALIRSRSARITHLLLYYCPRSVGIHNPAYSCQSLRVLVLAPRQSAHELVSISPHSPYALTLPLKYDVLYDNQI